MRWRLQLCEMRWYVRPSKRITPMLIRIHDRGAVGAEDAVRRGRVRPAQTCGTVGGFNEASLWLPTTLKKWPTAAGPVARPTPRAGQVLQLRYCEIAPSSPFRWTPDDKSGRLHIPYLRYQLGARVAG